MWFSLLGHRCYSHPLSDVAQCYCLNCFGVDVTSLFVYSASYVNLIQAENRRLVHKRFINLDTLICYCEKVQILLFGSFISRVINGDKVWISAQQNSNQIDIDLNYFKHITCK